MKIIPLPASAERQEKKRASLARADACYSVGVIAFAVLAVLCTLAVFITVIVFEFKSAEGNLLYLLMGVFAGCAIAFALGAFGLNLLGRRHRAAELDFRERCVGEESFFVGEGVLAVFTPSGLSIRGETGGKEPIRVPYSEMRFFSVCTRRAPKERGEWSVVLEIPAHYLSKKGGKGRGEERPALVQTDAKPRLYETLSRHGLTLLGERQEEGSKPASFALVRKFILPEKKKRTRALAVMALSVLLMVGGGLAGVFWNPAAGALLGAVGLFAAARSLVSFLRAKGVLGVYEEGLYWRDTNRAESVFLKWEEIVSLSVAEKGGAEVYRVACAYGDYYFPAVAGSVGFLQEKHPEKWGPQEKTGPTQA